MRPYGVKVIAGPDIADIQEMGSKGRVGKFPGKSGDFHPVSKGHSKAATRRKWKRGARTEGKVDVLRGVEEFEEPEEGTSGDWHDDGPDGDFIWSEGPWIEGWVAPSEEARAAYGEDEESCYEPWEERRWEDSENGQV